MRYLLIMNPGSRSGKSQENFAKIFSLFDQEKSVYDYKITRSLEEAYRLSQEGNRSGYDVIVAVGGDGTINQVLNGFYHDQGQRISKAKMGVIYTGTSPDFCQSYGIPLDLKSAVEVIIKQQTRKIPIGRIVLAESLRKEFDGQVVTDSARFITRYFACCANIGLGAALARRANGGIRGIFGDSLGTFLALVRTLLSYQPEDFVVCCDGREEKITGVYNISIGKTFYIASGIKVKNQLQVEDDRFYRLVVRNLKIKDWPRIIIKIYSGREIKNDQIISLDYLRTIDVLGNSRNPEVEFDGDPAGFLPCRISMAREGLEIICQGKDENYGRGIDSSTQK